MGLREDQIMGNFSSRLKAIAERYNVYVSTATQLNRNSNDREARDASAIRGGKIIFIDCYRKLGELVNARCELNIAC